MEKLLKSGDISEYSIQKAVMQWVNLNPALRNFVIHLPNEGKRSPSFAKLLKSIGMRPGACDLFIAMQRHNFGGAWIELKSKKGILSHRQKKFIDDMTYQNYFTHVCYSIEDAIETIKWYCFNDGSLSRSALKNSDY